MKRIFPTEIEQRNSHKLRNLVCRLSSHKDMASVSSHLRNYNVAELIGLVGILDSHPKIKGVPLISANPAKYQQTKGTVSNPLTHAIPCHLLLNKEDMKNFFDSAKAKTVVDRIFGMGVMAPDNWHNLDGFKSSENKSMKPSQVNIVDNINERYRFGDGLVYSLVMTMNRSVELGSWVASGVHQHNLSSLEDFVYHYYNHIWRLNASVVYSITSDNLQKKQQEAKESNDQDRIDIIQQRIDIVDEQRRVLQQDTINVKEVVRNLVSDTAGEKWE